MLNVFISSVYPYSIFVFIFGVFYVVGFVIRHLCLESLVWKDAEGAGRKEEQCLGTEGRSKNGQDMCVGVCVVLESRGRWCSLQN